MINKVKLKLNIETPDGQIGQVIIPDVRGDWIQSMKSGQSLPFLRPFFYILFSLPFIEKFS